MVLAVGRGLSTGRLLEVGSNNLVVFILALGIGILGLILRRGAAERFTGDLIRRSSERSADFLARLPARTAFYVWFGLCLGVVTGVAESAYRLYHGPPVVWPHALWLAPLTDGVLFLLVGAGLTVVSVVMRGGVRCFRVAFGVLLALSAIAMLILMLPSVHPAAAALLGLGVAVRLTGMLGGHAYSVAVVVRRSAWLAGLAAAAIMVWAFGGRGVDAQPHAPSTPPQARNVVLLVMDTVRARSLSLLGYQRQTTPSIEHWSRRGTVFQSAMSTAPWTLPSHAGMFTGRWTHELDTKDILKFDGTFPTIAEVMKDHGYATAGFVANLVNASRASGLARGFGHYEDFKINPGEALLSTSLGRTLATADALRNLIGSHELANRKKAPSINADFLHWLDQQDRGPFFAFLNYLDAHEPLLPPPDYASRFQSGPPLSRGPFFHQVNIAGPADWRKLSADQVANEQSLYEAAIASLDHAIGELLDGLEQRGLLKNTVVILTSDHGESFGENGVFSHGDSLYLTQLHVPLWILTPDDTRAVSVSETVSLRDLPATIIDLARVQAASPFPGRSLARFGGTSPTGARSAEAILLSLFALPGDTGDRQAPLARGNMRGVIEDPYHYIRNGDGVEELYDYRQDPREEDNLAASPAVTQVLTRLRELSRPISAGSEGSR